MMIIVGNLWGWTTGEWAHAPRRALVLLVSGILVQIAAISLLGVVNR